MNYIFDNYKFTVETDNANNIVLEEINSGHKHSIVYAIKKFIIFLHKNNIQYIIIYDSKQKNRYINILKYIYKKADNTERWLLNKATFITDGDNILCKIW